MSAPPSVDICTGLTREQVVARLAEFGPNVLAEPQRPSHVRGFAANLVHLFALLLWLGAGLALVGACLSSASPSWSSSS